MKIELWGIMVAGAALMDLAAFGTVEADKQLICSSGRRHQAREDGK